MNNKWLALLCLIVVFHTTHAQELRVVDAAKNDDMDTVQSLIRSGADVNIPGADGSTALSFAAHHNNKDMLDVLLIAALPYVAVVLFLLVSIQRYRRDPFTFSSLSSQFLTMLGREDESPNDVVNEHVVAKLLSVAIDRKRLTR